MKLHEPSGWWVPDFYPSGPGSYIGRSKVIEYALSLHDGPRRTVIQAGAHIGVWPKKLFGYFEKVICFEPVPSNWECLVKNLEGKDIELHHTALGPYNGAGRINHRVTSSGGHHMATRLDVPYIDVEVMKLDDMALGEVDAMFLDIEGFEIEALKGAEALLATHPLLVIENNGCSEKFGYGKKALATFLKPYGYVQVSTHGEDVIFHAH